MPSPATKRQPRRVPPQNRPAKNVRIDRTGCPGFWTVSWGWLAPAGPCLRLSEPGLFQLRFRGRRIAEAYRGLLLAGAGEAALRRLERQRFRQRGPR